MTTDLKLFILKNVCITGGIAYTNITQLSRIFLNLTLFRPGFFLLPWTGGGGSGGPTPATLQPLIV